MESGQFRASNIREAVEEGIEWLRNHGGAQTIEREPGEIGVDEKGIKNSLSHKFNQEKLDAVPAIVPTLKEGAYIASLQDMHGKPINNFYFAARIRIGNNDNVLFVRTRQAAGGENKFYVYEAYTEDEILKSVRACGVAEPNRPFQGAKDFYKNLIAQYLEVKGEEESGSENPDNPQESGQGEKAGTEKAGLAGSFGKIPTPPTGEMRDVFLEGNRIRVEGMPGTASYASLEKLLDKAVKAGNSREYKPLSDALQKIKDNEREAFKAELGRLIDREIEAGRRLNQNEVFKWGKEIYAAQKSVSFNASTLAIYARDEIADRLEAAVIREWEKGGPDKAARIKKIEGLIPSVITSERRKKIADAVGRLTLDWAMEITKSW